MPYLRRTLSPEDRRKHDLAAIHAGAKQLGMEEDARRDLIERISAQSRGADRAVRSAGDLNIRERAAVLDELRRLGAGTPAKTRGKPKNMDIRPMLTRIEQLLTQLQLPWAYADAIAQRFYKIERCAWLKTYPQLQGVIAALDAERKRREKRGAP